MIGSKLRAVIGIALAQLRYDRMRTTLAVLGMTLAVLAMTLLAGTGVGVIETGEQKFDAAGRDLWVTGGPVQFTPGAVGGIKNPITDAHTVARDMRQRDTIGTAAPLLFQSVYVSPNRSEFTTIAAAGVRGSNGLRITRGEGFKGDVHYGNGSYEGPMTHEVLIDERTAALFDVSVGDTLYIGGTVVTARQHKFTVVGISPTMSRFLGMPTVTIPLSELQEITGTTGTDPATLITIKLTEDANVQQVETQLEAAYPQYDIRTNREQLEATLKRQAVVLASGISLVVLAVLAGLALTINVFLSFVHQQRTALAAIKALGCSTTTLVAILLVQGLILGILAGVLGLGLTFPAAALLDHVATAVTGFENVVRTPRRLVVGGALVAPLMSLIGAVAAGIRLSGLSPLDDLDS